MHETYFLEKYILKYRSVKVLILLFYRKGQKKLGRTTMSFIVCTLTLETETLGAENTLKSVIGKGG